MAGEMKIFESKEFGSVRVVDHNGEPWFVAIDVCACLGLSDSNMAVQGLDDDEKSTPIKVWGLNDYSGLRKDALIITEAGLYSLIIRSNRHEAKAFKRWVTHEVLPSIRKTGGYGVQQALPDFSNPVVAARAWADALEQKQLAEAQRDHAVATKALIGSRREATAMATASMAVRKANTLEVKANDLETQLGIAGGYRTVKSLKWLSEIFDVVLPATYSQIGKMLNKMSKAMNHEAVKIDDPKFGTVNGYHVDVIDRFHSDILSDDSILGKYRR